MSPAVGRACPASQVEPPVEVSSRSPRRNQESRAAPGPQPGGQGLLDTVMREAMWGSVLSGGTALGGRCWHHGWIQEGGTIRGGCRHQEHTAGATSTHALAGPAETALPQPPTAPRCSGWDPGSGAPQRCPHTLKTPVTSTCLPEPPGLSAALAFLSAADWPSQVPWPHLSRGGVWQK